MILITSRSWGGQNFVRKSCLVNQEAGPSVGSMSPKGRGWMMCHSTTGCSRGQPGRLFGLIMFFVVVFPFLALLLLVLLVLPGRRHGGILPYSCPILLYFQYGIWTMNAFGGPFSPQGRSLSEPAASVLIRVPLFVSRVLGSSDLGQLPHLHRVAVYVQGS